MKYLHIEQQGINIENEKHTRSQIQYCRFIRTIESKIGDMTCDQASILYALTQVKQDYLLDFVRFSNIAEGLECLK